MFISKGIYVTDLNYDKVLSEHGVFTKIHVANLAKSKTRQR